MNSKWIMAVPKFKRFPVVTVQVPWSSPDYCYLASGEVGSPSLQRAPVISAEARCTDSFGKSAYFSTRDCG